MAGARESPPAGTFCGQALQYGAAQRRSKKDEDRWRVVQAPAAERAGGDGAAEPWADAVFAVYDGAAPPPAPC